MNKYDEMSDFKVNKAVANLVREPWINLSVKSSHPSALHIIDYNGASGCGKHSYPDYCNNPSDAWPIILESRINIIFDDLNAFAAPLGSFKSSEHVAHANPLRAAMICFLLMKDGEDE